jgi:hypothetical protein
VVREACSWVLMIHMTWSVSCNSNESSTSNVITVQCSCAAADVAKGWVIRDACSRC